MRAVAPPAAGVSLRRPASSLRPGMPHDRLHCAAAVGTGRDPEATRRGRGAARGPGLTTEAPGQRPQSTPHRTDPPAEPAFLTHEIARHNNVWGRCVTPTEGNSNLPNIPQVWVPSRIPGSAPQGGRVGRASPEHVAATPSLCLSPQCSSYTARGLTCTQVAAQLTNSHHPQKGCGLLGTRGWQGAPG